MMKKFDTIADLKSAEISPEFKGFIVEKSEKMVAEYGLDDISNVFSVIVLDENEVSYIADKYLEFCEKMTFDGVDWIHMVWIVSDGYGEDIYIPYTAENMSAVERRC